MSTTSQKDAFSVKFLYTHCKESLHFYSRVKLYLVDSYCFVILARRLFFYFLFISLSHQIEITTVV